VTSSEKYVWKDIPGSSHDLLRRRILEFPPALRLLDLGAAGGHLSRAVRDRCSYLAGVEADSGVPAAARALYDDWREADVLAPLTWDEPFDVVVCADVLEHLPEPEMLMDRIRGWLKPGGTLLASIPNTANLTVRLGLLLGRFEYAERGLLDRTHLRFYTRASARRLLEGSGLIVRRVEATAMPYELALPMLSRSPLSMATRSWARFSARLWPTLFGYQFLFEAQRA
jgi:2-polyprenyl-3-methyl-5-hydroxy-6-metoxy-1,4-benzoquinol methylase